MGRFVPITVTTVAGAEKPSVFSVPGGKGYYDGKQCWQYKVVYDRPGTYSYTVPSTAICVRTVIVGGGGKPKCFAGGSQGCCSTAGSGGAYSEKCMVGTGSPVLTVVVGRQEQDSTLACNSVAVHTAGGASGCVAGAASGGDWNSNGGCTGGNCFSNDGTCYCYYQCFANCCGYCIVYICNPAGTCATGINAVGGASAGSPKNLTGGCSSCVCGYLHSTTTGGGAGIGDTICGVNFWSYPCCSCICLALFGCAQTHFCYNYPTSNQGGGGSAPRCSYACRSTMQECLQGYWKSGDGGPGGPDNSATYGWEMEWGYQGTCLYPFGIRCYGQVSKPRCACAAPVRMCVLNAEQWDIQNICGTGSPGTGLLACNSCYPYNDMVTPRPRNSGEGAGTGGFSMYKCGSEALYDFGIGDTLDPYSHVNWPKLCQLGSCGHSEQAWLMQDSLFPQFLTCAGTLGGSGGVGICSYTSRAGKGGGGGQSKNQFLCVCHGGSYDLCNGSGPALAFPPCLLDQLVSNAGTGMAIIYYREA